MIFPIEVEPNDNCRDGMPMQVFESQGEPVPVQQVKIYREGNPPELCSVTGWSSDNSGSPCPAYYVPVGDSGAGVAYLLYGGAWGIRLKPAGTREEWDIKSPKQWGEPYLVLMDKEDIIPQ